MIVDIPAGGPPKLLDAYNFRELKVVGDPRHYPQIGRIDEMHVFIDPETLIVLACSAAADPEWKNAFAEMTTFAAQHSWVDDIGFIRAHVEARCERSAAHPGPTAR